MNTRVPVLGKTVSHYRIEDRLGEGGMGIVYAATDIQLHRRVAIKFAAEGQDLDARRRLAEEARAASSLNHPNIGQIYDFGETGEGVPFFVMELVEGQSLKERIRAGPMAPQEVVRLAEEIASALSHAHRKGIVHRDIKPANICITENGSAKVLDFGIAKRAVLPVAPMEAVEAPTASQPLENILTAIKGTPPYMSPEQVSGRQIDSRSDLFSLGIVLYECLTGKRPFHRNGAQESIIALQTEDPPPPSAVIPAIPKALDAIVLKLLARKPSERYQSAAALVGDLRAIQHSSSHSLAGLLPPRKRSRRLVLICISLTLASAAGGFWRYWSERPYRPKPEAQRWYDEGLKALRDGTYRKAAKSLSVAVKLDDGFLLAHARLAEAWFELEYREQATQSMLRAISPGFNLKQLVARDALTIEAIRYTVTGEYSKSVEKYVNIEAISGGGDRAWALFELARAQERLNESKKAADSYQRSIALDSQNIPAILRLGQLLSRQRKYPEAEAALRRAEELYQDASNVEGVNEAMQSIALLEKERGNYDRAEALLQKALELARANENQLQQVNALRLLSQVSIRRGQADAAERFASQAIELARANGEENVMAQALMELGAVHRIRGQPAEALKDNQQALEIGRRNKAAKIEMRALINLGDTRVELDQFQEAIPDLEAALKLYDSARSLGNSFNARILLQRAWHGAGDYRKADSYLKQIAGELQPGRDDQQIRLIEEATGNLRNDQGHFRQAIPHWERSYQMNEAGRFPYGMGVALLGKSASLWQLGDYEGAGRLLDQAEEIAKAGGFSGLTDGILIERVRIAFSRHDVAGIERLLGKMNDRSDWILELRILQGLTLGRKGALKMATPACKELLGRSTAQPLPLLAARTQLTCAEVALEAGDKARSDALATEARNFFSRNLCHEAGWRASLLLALSRPGAQPDAARVEEGLRVLERDWTPEDVKRYLNRPDIGRLYLKLNKLKENRS